MKKTILSLLLATSTIVATAQTIIPSNIVRATNGNLLLQGTNSSGVATQSVSITNVGYISGRGINLGQDGVTTTSLVASGNSNLQGNLTVGGTSNFNGVLNANRGIFANGNTITGVANGALNSTSQQAVNGQQLHTTNTRVTNLENTKADKSQVDALDNKVNTEVSRLDGRIDATNTRVDNLDNRVTTEVNRLDNEIVKTNNVVEANRITAANATAQVQTNLNTQVTRLDNRIDATNHNVSVLRSEVEANHKKAMDADEQIRTDLRTENQRALRAEQALGDRVDGLGATMMAFGSMASSAVFDPKKRGNMSFGVGTYQKSVAYAVGVSYYTTPNTRVSLNFAGGNNSKLGAGVGASFGF
jgi:predicted  nucleic acid-binding Zn-ribbon protein